MTDGTGPNEGEHPATAASPPPSAPVPPAAVPPQLAPQPAPVPPYAASVPPYAAQYPPSASAGPGGGPRQEYPGAPPSWGPAPGGPWQQPSPTSGQPWQPGPPRGGSSVLAILALVGAILGALVAFLPFVGGVLAFPLLLTAVVLAIIALVRRAPGKGMAIAAIIVAAVGALLALSWTFVFFSLGGSFSDDPPDQEYESSPSPEYFPPSLSAPDLGDEGATVADPLATGTALLLIDDVAGEEVWEITVGPFEDITAQAAASAEAPVYGALLAVPVELTNLTDETIDVLDTDYVPFSTFVTGDGGEAELAYVYSPEDYPSIYDVEAVGPGETVIYYEIYDVGQDAMTTGAFGFLLDSGQEIFWGPGVPDAGA